MTGKQRKFVEAYMASGNATEAARQAGYAHPNTAGPRLLVNDGIAAELEERQQKDPAVATREERQQFWSDVMRGVAVGVEGSKLTPDLNQRLKASELLGKTGGDFVERSEGELLIRVKREEHPMDTRSLPEPRA